jgi:hypothetical protein
MTICIPWLWLEAVQLWFCSKAHECGLLITLIITSFLVKYIHTFSYKIVLKSPSEVPHTVTQLYGLPHGTLHVFNTIVYENEFQNPQMFETDPKPFSPAIYFSCSYHFLFNHVCN